VNRSKALACALLLLTCLLALPVRAEWPVTVTDAAGRQVTVPHQPRAVLLGAGINLVALYLYGNPETGTVLAGYLGFFLLGAACLAVGQFLSALTHNQIVAALATASLLLALWFVGHLQNFQNSALLRDLFGYLSFAGHFNDFVSGLVRSDAVSFYLAATAIALTLNASFLAWRR